MASFLKVAESVGIDRTEIPDLTRAPASLLEALEAHLVYLEGGRAPPTVHHVNFLFSFNFSLNYFHFFSIFRPYFLSLFLRISISNFSRPLTGIL